MPHPIPEWDLARRLVMYVGMRQSAGQWTAIRAVSLTLGISRENIEQLMYEKNIIFYIYSPDPQPNGKDLLFLRAAPPNLLIDAGVISSDLERTYLQFLDGEQEARPIRVKRLKKKEREKLKVREFWREKRERGDGDAQRTV